MIDTVRRQRRRGTTAENDAFIGAQGEITVDYQAVTLRLHDGVTAGGKTIGTIADVQALIDDAVAAEAVIRAANDNRGVADSC